MRKSYSHKAKALILLTAVAFLGAQAVPAHAATKTITCYKGTVVKKVTAVKPVCPKGYTTTKPKVTTKATSTPVAAAEALPGISREVVKCLSRLNAPKTPETVKSIQIMITRRWALIDRCAHLTSIDAVYASNNSWFTDGMITS
jgi:hypothetical protein